MSSLKTLKSKKGQVTIFIIIAIIIIAAVLLFLFLSGTFTKGLFPEAKEAQQKFLGCVELKTRNALSIAGMQVIWNFQALKLVQVICLFQIILIL